MKILTSLFVLGGILFAGASSHALAQITYGYVDNGGALRVINANTPEQALAESAPNRASNSGVMEIVAAAAVALTNTNLHTYAFVDTEGTLHMQVASSPEAAIANAPNRAPNSGVMLITK